MPTALQQKIEKIKDEHAESVHQEIVQQTVGKEMQKVLLMLGAVGGFNNLKNNLNSKVILALQKIRDDKMYRSLGFQTFETFLDEYEYAPMKYKKFNYIEKQFELEGTDQFDALNTFGIPVSTRKLLSSGESRIEIEGDKIFINEQEVATTDTGSVKEIIKDLANEIRLANEQKTKQSAKVESLETQLKHGRDEYQELQRAVDAQSEGTKYEQCLAKAVASLINLTNEAKDLTLLVSQDRGRGDIESLWQQMLLFRSALYQEDFAFLETSKADKKGISKRAMQVIAENDDFGDEDEQ